MKRVITLVLAVFTVFSNCYSQTSDILEVSAKPIEKIVVNTDRNLYMVGEKLWFKAHCYTDMDETDQRLSNVIYVELYDLVKKSSIKKKFNIENGKSFGAIDLPLELSSGTYLLRSYTQYLKNFSPLFYSTQIIRVINPANPLPAPVKSNTALVKFEVEGGKLIAGIDSRISYQIRNDHIKNVQKIELYKNDELIQTPELSLNGVGLLEISPGAGDKFELKLIEDEEKTQAFALPEISESGTSIKASYYLDRLLNVNIHHIGLSPQNAILKVYDADLNLLANNETVLSPGTNNLSINKNQLAYGLIHLVLENSNQEIISAISMYNGEIIPINVQSDMSEYGNREAVSLDLNTNTTELKNVSVSIFKRGSRVNGLHNSYLNNPVLLKSYLQNLNIITEQLPTALISYANKVLPTELRSLGEYITIDQIPEIRDVSVSGKVIRNSDQKPIKNETVFLAVFNKNPQIQVAKTNKEGDFVFSLNNLEDNQELFISIENESDEEYTIRINNDFSGKFSILNELNLDIDESYQRLLSEMNVNMQANKIFETEAFGLAEGKQTFPFSFSNYDEHLDLQLYINSPDLQTVFRELIPSIKVRKKQGDFELTLYDLENGVRFDDPIVLVDNLPIFDMNEVMKVSPRNIKNIALINHPFLLSDETLNGVVMINTSTRNFGGITFNPGSVFMEYQTIANPFKMAPIDYSLNQFKSQRLADFRNMLHWEANLQFTDQSTVEFFTSDHNSVYDVIVKGFTADGKICYGETSFTVR